MREGGGAESGGKVEVQSQEGRWRCTVQSVGKVEVHCAVRREGGGAVRREDGGAESGGKVEVQSQEGMWRCRVRREGGGTEFGGKVEVQSQEGRWRCRVRRTRVKRGGGGAESGGAESGGAESGGKVEVQTGPNWTQIRPI